MLRSILTGDDVLVDDHFVRLCRCSRRRWISVQPDGHAQLKRPNSGNSQPNTTAESAVTSPTPPLPYTHTHVNMSHQRPLADKPNIT